MRLTGRWAGTRTPKQKGKTPECAMELTLIETPGGALLGSYVEGHVTSASDYTSPTRAVRGTRKADAIELHCFAVRLEGEVDGDQMWGSFNGPDETRGTWLLTRVAA